MPINVNTRFLGVDSSKVNLVEKKDGVNNSKQEYYTIEDISNAIGAGPQGPQGVEGPAGPQGPIGPVGPAGLEWQGLWVAETSYVENDAVGYNGASWFCIADIGGDAGNDTPDVDGTHWALLAAQGAQGPQGLQGAQGPTGPQGPAGVASYKSYVARVSHGAGNSAPTAVVLENTIGTVTWQYDEEFNYLLVSSGLFTLGKTVVFATSPTFPLMKVGVGLSNSSPNFIGLTTDNDSFSNLMFEVRVYN